MIAVSVLSDKKMVEAVCGVIHLTRKKIALVMGQTFDSAVTHESRKLSSLTVFTTIVKRMHEFETTAIAQLAFVYLKLKAIVASYAPSEGQAFLVGGRPLTGFHRTEMNEFVAETLKSISSKARSAKHEANGPVTTLYRLLELRQRIRNPKSQTGYDIDLDMRITLEDKIAEAAVQVFE